MRISQLVLLTSKYMKLKPAVDIYNSVFYIYTSLSNCLFFSTSPRESFLFSKKQMSLSMDRIYDGFSDFSCHVNILNK